LLFRVLSQSYPYLIINRDNFATKPKELNLKKQDHTCKLPIRIILMVTTIVIVTHLDDITKGFNDFILNERPSTEIYLEKANAELTIQHRIDVNLKHLSQNELQHYQQEDVDLKRIQRTQDLEIKDLTQIIKADKL
jgi:hypothetical protein